MKIEVTTQTGKQLHYEVQQSPAELAEIIHIGSYETGSGGLAYLVLPTNKIVLVPKKKVETVAIEPYTTLGVDKGDLICITKPAQPIDRDQDGTHWGIRNGEWGYITKELEQTQEKGKATDSADEAF